MRSRRRLSLVFLVSVGVFTSCSSTPEQIVAKHSRRGDEYMQKEKFREAVIEYKNAVKAGPNDGKLHWKLAQAALEARDLRTAFAELQTTLELDPANHEAMGRLGEIYVAAGKVEEGAGIADNLVRSRPQDPQGHILKSGLALRRGKVDEAIRHMRTAVELDPKGFRSMLTLGNLHVLKRDRKAALEWYDKALAAEPNAPEVYVARGNFFFASGERDEGEKAYRKAIDLSKEKEMLRIALAEHYLFLGRLEDSEKELVAVITELKSQKARKVLAEIKLDTGKVADAKDIVDAILKENEKDLDGKYLKGRIALAERRLDDAKTLFGGVVKQDAGMSRARLYNGVTDVMLGQVEVGKKEIQEAVKIDPGNLKAHLVLGDLYLRSGIPADAEKEALEVLRRNPANVPAATIYADSFLLRKDFKKAEQIYGAMIKQMPKSSIGYLKMGLSRKYQKKPAEAASYFEQAVERNPKDLTGINEYVFALAAAGKGEKAFKTLDALIAKDPKNPILWDMAGRLHVVSRKPAEAEKAFLKAIDLAPDYSRPYYELGVIYTAQRRLSEAEARFRKLLGQNDRNAGAHALLGVVLNFQGKIDESNTHYRRVLELVPRSALAANNLASNLSEHGGNLDEALKFAQIAREAAPEDPNVADTLGWVYYRKGLYDTAYPLIAEASRELARSAVVRYHHGMVLARKGRSKEARAELSAALALDGKFPGADDARKTLASLK